MEVNPTSSKLLPVARFHIKGAEISGSAPKEFDYSRKFQYVILFNIIRYNIYSWVYGLQFPSHKGGVPLINIFFWVDTTSETCVVEIVKYFIIYLTMFHICTYELIIFPSRCCFSYVLLLLIIMIIIRAVETAHVYWVNNYKRILCYTVTENCFCCSWNICDIWYVINIACLNFSWCVSALVYFSIVEL